MHVFLGSDHGGFVMKEMLQAWLAESEEFATTITDCGAFAMDPDDDYPEFGFAVAENVSRESFTAGSTQNPDSWGILLCRTGAGMAIAANRVQGVRAVVCRTAADATHARAHNNANILVLEADHIDPAAAQNIITLFFRTRFDGGRHARRVAMLDTLPAVTTPGMKSTRNE